MSSASFFRLFYLSLYFTATQGFALYNGNPSSPMMPETGLFIPQEYWLGVKGGYEADFVYDQKLRFVGRGSSDAHKNVKESHLLSQLGILTFNFFSRVELFTAFGTLSCQFKHHPFRDKISYYFDPQFAWGMGGNAILVYWGDVQLGVNAFYLSSDSTVSTLKVNGRRVSKEGNPEMHFRQWQVGVGASYRYHWIIPYLGVDFLDCRARIDYLKSLDFIFPSHHLTFKDTYPMGLYLGCGIVPEKGINLNIEARFFNENGCSISAALRF